jgi:hypothetical protein
MTSSGAAGLVFRRRAALMAVLISTYSLTARPRG